MGTSPLPNMALFVAPDLTYFETASPESYADDVTVSGVPHRRLDAAYYAWLRHKMDLGRKAVAARRLVASTFEALRERFNVLHAWAVERLGAQALAVAVKSFDPRRYDPPRPDDDLAGPLALVPRPPAGPSGHAYPKSGDWPFTEPVAADAVAKVDAIHAEALAVGWTDSALYQNRGSLRFPYGGDYGLVCFLDDGARIAAVTRESITIEHVGGSCGFFPNPAVAQPWRRAAQAVPV